MSGLRLQESAALSGDRFESWTKGQIFHINGCGMCSGNNLSRSSNSGNWEPQEDFYWGYPCAICRC
jgi:hypothetical protein